MQGINTNINVNVKTSGLDELKNELKEVIQVLENNNISIPINVNTIKTEEEAKNLIKSLKELAEIANIDIDVELGTPNIRDIKEVEEQLNNIAKAKAEAAMAGADDFDNMFDNVFNDSKKLDTSIKSVKKDIELLASNMKVLAKTEFGDEFVDKQKQLNIEISDTIDKLNLLRDSGTLNEDELKNVDILSNKLGLLQNELDSLNKQNLDYQGLNRLASLANSLNIKVPGTAKNLGTLIRDIGSLSDGGKQLGSVVKSLLGNVSAGTVVIGAVVASITAVIAIIGKLTSEVQKIKSQLLDLVKNGFELLTASIKKIPAVMNNIVNGLKSVGSTLVNIGDDLVSVFKALGGSIVNFFKDNVDLSSITDTFSNIGGDIASAISDGVVKSGSLMVLMTDEQRAHLASLTTETERYNYIMSQSANIQGQWAGVMDSTNGRLYQMSVWMNTLKSAVTQLANSLLSILAPIITKVVQLATAAVSVIAKLFGIDLSSSINKGLSSAGKSIESGVSNIGKSAKKSSKKASKDIKETAKEVKLSLLPFDDVMQLNEDAKTESLTNKIDDLGDVDAGGIGDLSNALGGLTSAFGDMFNLKMPEWLQKILDLLNKGDFFGTGALLIQTLVDWLKAIDWDDLGNKLNNFAKHFAEFLNGIFSNTQNWGVIGKSLGKALNALFSMLETFADTFDFKQFGKSITAALNGMIETIDWRQVGRTLYKYLAGLFDVIHELVDGNVIYNALIGISQAIREFFENLTSEDAKQWGNDLGNAISQVLFGLAGIIDSIDFGDIIKTLQSSLHRIIEDGGIQNFGFSIVNALTEAIRGVDAEQLGTDIAELFNQISNVVISFLTNLDIEQFKEAFISLFTRLSENNTIGRIIQAIADLLTNTFNSITPDDMNRVDDAAINIVDGILNGLLSIANSIDVEKLIEFVRTLLDRVKEWFDNGGKEKIQELVDKITQLLKDADVQDMIRQIGETIRYILDSIDINALLDEIIGIKLSIWAEKLKTKIDNWFKSVKEAIKIFIDNVVGGIKQFAEIISVIFKGIAVIIEDFVLKLAGVKGGLKDVANLFGGSTNRGKSVSWSGAHATGGITNGPSIGLIGEAGREAILPLDNNTDWMNILANRINSNNNTSGNNTPVMIDLNTINKPFYTKAEMLELGIMINNCLQVANANT